MFSLDLIRVIITRGVCDTHLLVVNIENEVVLAHQSASKQKLRTILNIDSDTVSTSFLSVKILTWVPVESEIFVLCPEKELKDGEGTKVVVGAVRELFLAIVETQETLAREIHTPLAVILWVE